MSSSLWSTASPACIIPQTTILTTATIATLLTVNGLTSTFSAPSFPTTRSFFATVGFLPRAPPTVVVPLFATPKTVLLSTAPHHTVPISLLATNAQSSSSPSPALSFSNRLRKADTAAMILGSPSVPGSGSTIDHSSRRPSRHVARSRDDSVSRWCPPPPPRGKDAANWERCESMDAAREAGRSRDGKGLEVVLLLDGVKSCES